MNCDDIIRIARKAGWSGIYTKPLFSITMKEDDFLRFAALVAAEEREACAKVCDDAAQRWRDAGWDDYSMLLKDAAHQLRLRNPP